MNRGYVKQTIIITDFSFISIRLICFKKVKAQTM